MRDKANDRQVGGNHYKKFEYEPWDFFHDASVHPILAFAIKYVVRWRDKNGVADLEKAIHCLEKCNQIGVLVLDCYWQSWHQFAIQLSMIEREIFFIINKGKYTQAIDAIQHLINTQQEQAQ